MFMIFNADQARVVADFEGAVQCTSELIQKFASLALGIESTILAEERTDFPLLLNSKRRLLFLVNASYKPSACNNGSLCY